MTAVISKWHLSNVLTISRHCRLLPILIVLFHLIFLTSFGSSVILIRNSKHSRLTSVNFNWQLSNLSIFFQTPEQILEKLLLFRSKFCNESTYTALSSLIQSVWTFLFWQQTSRFDSWLFKKPLKSRKPTFIKCERSYETQKGFSWSVWISHSLCQFLFWQSMSGFDSWLQNNR